MPSVAVAYPWWLLLLLPLALGTVWVHRRSLAGLSPQRARTCTVVRLGLLTLLVAALAGITYRFPSQALDVLFLLDRSASIPPAAQARQLELVNDAARRLPPNAQAGVLVFGERALLEREPSRTPEVRQVHSLVGNGGSDVAAALRLGAAVLPDDRQRRLVLISDGDETRGEALTEASAAAAAGIQVDVIPVERPRTREALLEKLISPERAKRGEPLSLRVLARSTEALPARVRLFRDGAQVDERSVDLRAGANAIDFRQTLLETGFHSWEATLEARGDTVPDNNRALGFTYLQGEPEVLLIEGTPGDGDRLAQELQRRSLRVERRNTGGLPGALSSLARYDSVVMVNVRADQVGPEQMKLLRSAVQDLGIGLVMVGGPDALTAGGWRGTPVEEALPVDMRVERRQNEPAMAMVLVIDCSSSMGAAIERDSKLRFAREAAAAALEDLRPEDEVGVVAFSDAPWWAVPLGKLGDKQRARSGIAELDAAGGTNLYPALVQAREALARSHAAVKHVLVLTDGQSLGGDFDGAARSFARDRITMSTVGVGQDADGKLLSRLASVAGGRYYPAVHSTALPFIFDRETRLASKAALVEEPFRPQAQSGDFLLRDLPPAPALLGYVATTAKQAPGVEVPLLSHRGEPIVAGWRYGLGRAVVVTTDAKARWAAPWIADAGGYFSSFWPHVVRSTLRSTRSEGLDAQVNIAGEEGRVVVDALTPGGEFRNGLALQGRVAGPEGGQSLRLEQTGPGRYEGRFDASSMGQYVASFRKLGSSQSALTVAGAAVPYSPEYRSLESGSSLLLGIAERTGGQAWPALGPGLHGQMLPRLFRPGRPARSAPRELWPYLTLGGALLLPLDVGMRRVGISRAEWVAAVTPMWEALERRFRGRTDPDGPRDEGMGRLLTAKSRAARPEAPEVPEAPPVLRPAAQAPAAPAGSHSEAPEPEPGASATGRLLAAKRRAGSEPPRNRDASGGP